MDPPASAVPPPPIPAHPHAGGKKSRHDPTHRGVADAESSHTSPTGGKKRRHRSSSVPEKSRSSNSVPSDDGGTGPWIRVTAGGKRGSVHRDPVAVAAAVARRASGWTKQRALRQPAAPEPARELHVPRRMFGHHGVKVKLSHSFSQSSDDSQPHGADTALSSKQRRRRSRQRSRGSRANSAGAGHDDSAVVISSAASSSRGGSDQDGPVIVTPGQLSTESAGHPAVALSVPSPSTRSLARGQPIQLKPLVKCTDGLRTTTRSLRDILHAASGDGDDVYSLEADTPLVRPSDPQHVVPPMMLTAALAPPRLPRCNSEGRGSMDELTVPRHAFTVEGIATPNTFYAMPHHPMPPPLPHEQTYQDILAGFNPENHSFAWHGNPAASSAFAEQLMALCGTVTSVFRQQPLLRQLDAPAYVLGDIHGNFSDLSFFLRNFLVLNDINLTPGCQILCLGDYVDRGPHSVECVALLFALAMEAPDRVVLLRGNHEDRVVCGDRRIYGEECFWSQCCRRFGTVTGTRVFHCVTRVFRHLPLACELNLPHPHSTKILCTHGGFPRFNIHDRSSFERIKLLQRDDFPRFLTLFPNNPLAQDDSGSDTEELPDFVEAAWFTAFDLLWSDPTTDEDDQTVDENGFSCNARGMNVMSFSQKAVEHYLHATNYAMLFRAHQEKRFGLRLSKSSKVLTLFSSSNYQGHGNSAGCAIVSAQGSVQLIVKH